MAQSDPPQKTSPEIVLDPPIHPESIETRNTGEHGSDTIDRDDDFSQILKSETQQFVSILRSIQDSMHQPSSGEATVFLLPDQSAVALKENYESSLKQAEDLLVVSQQCFLEVQLLLERMNTLEVETTKEMVELFATIQEGAKLLLLIKDNTLQISRLTEQAREVHKMYVSALIREHGYDSFESLKTDSQKKWDEICSLRDQIFGIGVWWNRKIIGSLRAEIKKLDDVIKIAYRDVRVRGEGVLGVYQINGWMKQLFEQTIKKCMEYYERLLRENPEPQRKQESLLDIAELDSLNEQYIQTYVLPQIEKEKASCEQLINQGYFEYRIKLARLNDPEEVARLLDIVKRSYGEAPGRYCSDPHEEIKRQEFLHQIEMLSRNGLSLSSYINDRGYEPTNKKFEEFVYFILRQGSDKRPLIRQAYCEVLRAFQAIDDSSYEAKAKIRQLKQAEDNSDMGQFLLDFDVDRWDIFKTNPLMIARFGREQLRDMDRKIGQALKKQILQLPEHTDKCIQLGYKLYHLKEAEYVPLAILNAFRESGHSGEMPFLSVHSSNSKDTILYQYLTSLDPEEMQKLKVLNIPGCNETIDLILDNPTDFHHPTVRNEKTGKYEDNIIYHQIQKNLLLMIAHFLQEDDGNMFFYLIGLMEKGSPCGFLPIMGEVLKTTGILSQTSSNGLLRFLRMYDPMLRQIEEETSEPSAESYQLFHDGLETLLQALYTLDGALRKYVDVFQNTFVLQFIARQPERIAEVIELSETVPELFILLQPGGPLYTNKENVLRIIFENGDLIRRAKEISAVFTKKVPFWKQLFLFTESRIGDQLAAAISDYPITEVCGVSLKDIVSRHIQSKKANSTASTTLEGMIADLHIIEQLVSGNIASVTFGQFTGVYKKIIFRDYLRRTIESSRSAEEKIFADTRNRALTRDTLIIEPNTYIHGSAVDVIGSVMLNGNLPQEALGERAGTDSYPFHVDFTRLKTDYLAQYNNISDVFLHSLSKTYGGSGQLGLDGQIFYIYNRSKTHWEADTDCTTAPDGDHALLLGGMPSTEISGIVLRNADVTLLKVKKAVLEQGFYIPVYNIEGKLLMTPQDYDHERENENLSVSVEVWDYSLKTGEQLGSNLGGEFTVPEKGGSVKYYVKFNRSDSTDHLWNEQLSDNFYRLAGLDVPNTKIVKVEGAFGHASQIIEGHDPNFDEYRAQLTPGFIMDCWLANWDIAAKTDNGKIDTQTGRLSRIDNGGSLLFRAQGERKSNFGAVVIELETMRPSYHGLTFSDIEEQITKLREIFTDEIIDQHVDNVRLSKQDRDFLKTTLRCRRDYIISFFEKVAVGDMEHLTDEGREITPLLHAVEIDDARLAALVPEWEKLNSEAGYQHNSVLLGDHLKEAISILHTLPEYQTLNSKERDLAAIATLFHDMEKPTGTKDEQVSRDFSHEIPSANLAARYMQKWGYSSEDIKIVVQVILYDGIVSDIARGKVREKSKNLTPEQLWTQLNNSSIIKILRAVNHADVVATVGERGYGAIEQAYNEFFEKIISTI